MAEKLGPMTNIGSQITLADLLKPTATVILAGGDASVQNNQIDCAFGVGSQERFNSVVAGFTTRVVGNMFSDSYVTAAAENPGVSVVTFGGMNVTTSNQATRCLAVFGGKTVRQGNLSQLCPEVAEPSTQPSTPAEEPQLTGTCHWTVGDGQVVSAVYTKINPVTQVTITDGPGITPLSTIADINGNFSFLRVPKGVPLDIQFTVFLPWALPIMGALTTGIEMPNSGAKYCAVISSEHIPANSTGKSFNRPVNPMIRLFDGQEITLAHFWGVLDCSMEIR